MEPSTTTTATAAAAAATLLGAAGGGSGAAQEAGQQQVLQELATAAASQLQQAGADQLVVHTKLLASLILFAITLLCGYLPVRFILNQVYIQWAMFAGGGVLMATAFCHLIPEAHDSFKQITDSLPVPPLGPNQNSSSPGPSSSSGAPTSFVELAPQINYPEITLCAGFFFMYLVEILMVRFLNNHTHEHPCATSLGQLVVDSSAASIVSTQTGSFTNLGTVVQPVSQLSLTGEPQASGTHFYKFIRGLLIVSAFGAHSIFDGVAIGSQESVENVWTIFAAISCHKLIIAAVVGLELFAATLESHLWTLIHISIFSIMSPIGIILVVVAQNSLHINSNHPAMILLQSFASGTLLYIIFVEILQPKHGQALDKNKLGKCLSLIGGFVVMVLILTLIGHGD